MLVNSGDPSSTLRFIANDGRVFGQFYNSIDRKYHIAQYVPYKRPPTRYLCGKTGNFAASRDAAIAESKQCDVCYTKIWTIDSAQ
jgi:hypothetical protein